MAARTIDRRAVLAKIAAASTPRRDRPRYPAPVPPRIVVLYGHPYPHRSRAGRLLLNEVRDLPQLAVRSLYDLYPDFNIDVAAEQEALLAANLIVWQAPFYWYGLPSLFALWFEKVLTHGWAYGEGGRALVGKAALWVTTTGGPPETYRPEGLHGHPFSAFVPAIAQTAHFCGMRWLDPPIVVHGAHRLSADELHTEARRYRRRLQEACPSFDDAPLELPALPSEAVTDG